MNKVTLVHDFLELLYFLSGIGLLIIGFWGLKQLNLAKEQIAIAKKEIKTNSERESALLAAKQCEIFADKFLPPISKLISLTGNDKGLPKYSGKTYTFQVDSNFAKNAPSFFKKWSTNTEAMDIMAKLLNDLEAFSVYFTKKIADESIAFQSLGDVYCKTIEDFLYPFITVSRKDKNLFSNVVELYNLWRDRIRTQQLELELDNLLEEYENINPRQIRPTGTEE